MWYPIEAPDGTQVWPIKPDGTEGRWRWMKDTYDQSCDEVEFVKTKGRWEIYVKQWLEDNATRPPNTIWPNEEVGHNHEAKLEAQVFNRADTFDTPKPERLLQRILTLASQPGDLVLDSFLGSGTTAAVAHKMGRRWIGIEMGEHARTHCLPRLEKVIAGEPGGISEAVGWTGGGGFRFHTLGEPVFDADGGINPQVRFGALAGYLWHFETGQPAPRTFDSPLLGVHDGTAVFLLYNGILGDRKPAGGNVLTGPVLAHLEQLLAAATPAGQPLPARKVVYGETTRLGDQRLEEAGVSFRQIPYDIRAR